MKKRKISKSQYKIGLLILLSVSLVLISALTIKHINDSVPGRINLIKNEIKTIDFHLPITGEILGKETSSTVSFSSPVSFHAGDVGEYKINLKLFGLFELKPITINVLDEQQVFPCGVPIGIYLKTDGILVVNTGNLIDTSGNSISPCDNKIKTGDYITKINGEKLSSKSQLTNYVNMHGSESLVLSIRRNNEEIDVKVTPVLDASNQYKIGLWVKDDSQGIGTLTYIDGHSNFGALGHGISDSDTGGVLEINSGLLYRTKILSIVKGKSGEPGEFVGSIDYNNSNQLGVITKNCNCGIYGKIGNDIISEYNLEPMNVGYRYDVHKGKASIRVFINNTIKDYDIEITGINTSESIKTKNITFSVTSPELLDITGGVVQGMSGSPIIQDNKIIGAVTHVFVDNATYGYGIFIENMMSEHED